MNSSLDCIADWPCLARQYHYHIDETAQALGVSARWLEDYLQIKFGLPPHGLFARWRVQQVRELVRLGMPGKAIAPLVGLASYPSLCRSLKHDSGQTLAQWRRGLYSASSQDGNEQLWRLAANFGS